MKEALLNSGLWNKGVLMWTIFKVFLHLLQYCFVFWFFGPRARGILTPQSEIRSTLPALEGKVLTTRLPGKSQDLFFFFLIHKTVQDG